MKTILIGLALALSTAAAAQDATQEAAEPALSALIADLEAQGFRITEIDVDSDHVEVEARDQDGVPVELVLSRSTGDILSQTEDD